MKIEIDQDGCIGNGQCESICSDVFKVEAGKAVVLAKEVSDDRREEVLEAAEGCPVQVITVWNGSKRLYPE